MAQPGRNEPCPCGSGRKYKACCLDKEEAARRASGSASRPPLTGHQSELFGELADFAHREFGAFTKKGLELFPRLDDFKNESGVPFPFDERQEGEWLIRMSYGILFDYPVSENGEAIAARFLRRRSASLRDSERAWLQQMLQAPVTPYEILEVQRDVGLRARNLWSGEEMFINERLATRDVSVWDVLAGRVIRDGARLVLEGGAYLFPPEQKQVLEEAMAKHRLEIEATTAGSSRDPAFLMLFSAVIHSIWIDYALDRMERPAPRVVTSEGDDIEFTTIVFEASNAAAVEAALGQRPDFAAESQQGTFSWIEPMDEGSFRTLGRVVIRGARLTLDTQSKPRADRARELLLSLAPGSLVVTSTRSMSAAVALAKEKKRKKPAKPVRSASPGIPPAVADRLRHEFMDQHYRKWIDIPVPALNGETPQNASRTLAGRTALVNLLKSAENMEGRASQEFRRPYDFEWIWRELRLPRS